VERVPIIGPDAVLPAGRCAEGCTVKVLLGAGISTLRNYLGDEVVAVAGKTLTVDLGRYGFKLFGVLESFGGQGG
jgi:hypothetical protein